MSIWINLIADPHVTTSGEQLINKINSKKIKIKEEIIKFIFFFQFKLQKTLVKNFLI